MITIQRLGDILLLPKTRLTTLLCLLLCLLMQIVFLHVASANEEISGAPWGMNIGKVEFKGLKKIESEALLQKMSSTPGSALSSEVVVSDLKKIYSMNYFEEVLFNYRIDRSETEAKVHVLVKVKEKPTVQSIKFVGNDEEDAEELKKQIKSKEFSILDINLINSDVRALKKFYEDKGFFLAQVRYELKKNQKEQVDIIFHIKEQEQVKVKSIAILGNQRLSDQEIKDIMLTKEDGAAQSFGSGGNFRDFYFQADIERITYFYRTKGFIQVNVGSPVVTVSPDKRWIFITLQVAEGESFEVEEIEFKGDLLFEREKLLTPLGLQVGQIYNEEILRKDILTLTEMYQDEGYAFANVVRTLEPIADKKAKVKIIYQFEKGNKAYLGKIIVKGNTKTRDKVVRRELQIHEGMLFSGSKMRISKENVNRLGFFEIDSVIFNTKPSNAENTLVDVEILVKERQTGQITLGAGYSSVNKGFFNASIRQNNFRGLGQDLNFVTQLSSVEQTYEVGFTEPYFNDTRWSLGGTVYQRVSAFLGAYDFKRNGFDIRVGHPISTYTRAFVTYGYSDTKISNVKFQNIDPETENGVASGLEVALVRDKRNNAFEPTSGYWTQFAVEYVGLGGDFRWLRQEAEGRYYKGLFGDLVLRSRLRLARLEQTSTREIPRSQKFSMGGVRNMRGFSNDEIGPKELRELVSGGVPIRDAKGNPILKEVNVGGLFSALGTLELEHPLIEEAGLKWVVFYDAGNVFLKNIGEQNDYHLRSNYGLGMRWFSPIGLLRFELGFPISRKETEDASQFFFDVGQNF